MHTFKLKILTPDSKIFEGSVLEVSVPSGGGTITVLKNHTPLISTISIGELKVIDENKAEHRFILQGGVIDVKESSGNIFEVIILADLKVGADIAHDLDEEIKRAKEAMETKHDDIDFALEESTIERNLFLKRYKGK